MVAGGGLGEREVSAGSVTQVTYLFSDIEGSTGLWQDHPEAMAGALETHFGVVRGAIAAAGGEVVQDTGDGVFAVFPTAVGAVHGAVGVQRGLRDASWGVTGPLRVRIGLHTGTVDPNLRDYRGTSVNRAARVMDVAHGGQVVLSGPTRELLQDSPLDGLVLTDLGVHTLRGIAAAEHLWQVSAPDLESDFPPPRVKGGAVSAVCPYKGLAAFQPEDAELFFGREELVDRLVARLAQSRFLAVVGPSGSGKSSAVRAGLLPALGRGALPGSGAWVPLILTPTSEPVKELAHRLALSSDAGLAQVLADLEADPRGIDRHVEVALGGARPDARLLLVVDQFEELFTLCRDEEQRQAFVDLLLRLTRAEGPRASVVVALRADHYGNCARFPQLAGMLGDSQVLVGPMTDIELRRAVTGPAEAVGLDLEPALVDAVIADSGGGVGSLPLVSHALVETWARRSATTLTLEGYRQAGGVDGAIARTAESLYRDRFDEQQQVIARLIFLRLVEPGEDTADAKRRAALSELVPAGSDEDTVRAVLDEIVAARLITTDEASVELAHEALLREWPTLKRWLDDNRDGLRLLRHLSEAAAAWDGLDRDPGELYRGARLAAALEWLEGAEVDLNPVERAFIDASRDLAEAEALEAEQRALRQARQNRRLKTLLGATAALLVAAATAGTFAAIQRTRANDTAHLAQVRALAAEAVGVRQIDLGLLLAAEAARLGPDVPEARGALIQRLLDQPEVTRVGGVPVTMTPTNVHAAAGGGLLALSGDGGPVEVIDAASLEHLTSVDVPPEHLPGGLGHVVLSDDGRTLGIAVGTPPSAFIQDEFLLIDVASSTVTQRFDLPSTVEWPPTFLPGGARFAYVTDSRGAGTRVHVFDAATGDRVARQVFRFRTDDCEFGYEVDSVLAVSPTGAIAVVTECLGITFFEDAADSEPAWTAPPQTRPFLEGVLSIEPAAAVFAGGGRYLVVGDWQGGVVVHDARTGEVVAGPIPYAGPRVTAMAASPDGPVAVAHADGWVRTIDPITGDLLPWAFDAREQVVAVAPGPDPSSWTIGSITGTVVRWSPLSLSPALDRLTRGHASIGADLVRVYPRGRSVEDPLEVVDVDTGERREVAIPASREGDLVLDLAFPSPDGQAVLGSVMTFRDDAPARDVEVRDAASLEVLALLDWDALEIGPVQIGANTFLAGDVLDVAWARAAEELVVATRGGPIARFDAHSGDLVAGPFDSGVFDPVVAWSEARGEIYVPSREGSITVLDDALEPTGESLPLGAARFDALAVSPDGRLLAIGGGTGLPQVWDLDSRTRRATLPALEGGEHSLAFSPDGSVLAIQGAQGDLLLVDVASGRPLHAALEPVSLGGGDALFSPFSDGGPVDLTFAPDGGRVGFLASNDDIVALTLDVERLSGHACDIAGRNLTEAEWAQHLPADEPYRLTCPQWADPREGG